MEGVVNESRFSVPDPLVIRGLGGARGRWLVLLVVLVLSALIGVAYVLGRAGVSIGGPGVLSDRAVLRGIIRERDATIGELRRQVADLDTLKASQERERAELSRTIGELQVEVSRQRQQIEFLQGIVTTGSGPRPEVAIRSARIDRTADADRFVLRLSLVQPGAPTRIVTGRITVRIDGSRGRDTRSIRLAPLEYRFRYFETFEPEIVLPQGFTPSRVTVEVVSASRGVAPVVQSLIWPFRSGE